MERLTRSLTILGLPVQNWMVVALAIALVAAALSW
jgi:hypothetical protein